MPIRKLVQDQSRRKRSSAYVLFGGLALVTAIIVAFIALALFERGQGRLRDQAKLEVVARALEEQGTRSIESAFVILDSLASDAEFRAKRDPDALSSDTLRRLVAGLPVLRSVAIIDDAGRVIASSDPADIGASAPIARLRMADALRQQMVGVPIAGRSLRDVGGEGAQAPAGVAFIPLGRHAKLPDGSRATAVALLNPDALSSQLERSLSSPTEAAAYTSYDGVVLAASRSAGIAPGQRLLHVPVFEKYLPMDEHEEYVGAGVRDSNQIVAFRASHTRPIVAIAEESGAANDARWLVQMKGVGALTAGVLLVVLTMTALAWRGLRGREEARGQLDEALLKIALRERELSVLVKSVQELMFRTDEDGCLTFLNARAPAVFGQSPEALVGKRLVDQVDAGYRSMVKSLFDAHTEGSRNGRFAVTQPDGRQHHFDVAVVPLHVDGHRAGFVGSAVDVTERVQSTRKIKEQLAYSDLLFEISPLPMWLVDPEGGVVNVNHAWEGFHGISRRSALGRSLRALMGSDAAETASAQEEAQRAELRKAEGRLRYEARMRASDGTWRDVVVTEVEVPNYDGEMGGILSVMMDVSEFRDAERATREARDAAEEASRAKSEFVANISHELRTPLQAILGFSELGSDRSKDHPRAAGMFGDIHAAGQRMLALVNDLLDVSKIESAVGTFHLERGDVREAVRTVANEIGPLLSAKSIHLDVELGDRPLMAKVDPLRFQQVVRNVLANAIKFSPKQGQVDVRAAVTAANEIRISIRDRGPGIPPAELDKIFEAFVQSSTTRDGSGGTGLGLAISRTIMQAFGGHIRAENAVGGGSVFHLTLPLRHFSDTMPMVSALGGLE